jgi:hypothetical protein
MSKYTSLWENIGARKGNSFSKQYEVTSDMQQRGFGISCGKLTTSRHALPHAKEITS